MSRFESSTFIRNQNSMNPETLRITCDALGWKYAEQGAAIIVTDLGNGTRLHGEYALKLENNVVTYNSYYLPNATSVVQTLQDAYVSQQERIDREAQERINALNVEYSRTSVIKAFRSKGFTLKTIPGFVPDDKVKHKFKMVGRSADKTETEPVGEVTFSILADGSVVSDSNYLPADVNTRAHAAMDLIDSDFNSKRVMVKKPVPPQYAAKMKKSVSNVQKLNR